MSHEVETLAYSGQVPWHGLGIRVDDDISPEEMLVKAGLDWEVELRPLHFKNNDGEWIRGNRAALVRSTDERYLTTVGEKWKPTQNKDALDFFSKFVEAGQMTMETAGSLKEGQHVFALARFSRDFEVTKGDEVRGYILFHNPHVFGKSREVMQTSVRVVCNNTLTAALSGHGSAGSRYAVSHRMDFDPEEAEQVLGLAEKKITAYEEAAKFLVTKQAKPEKVKQYFQQIFPANDPKKVSRNAQIAFDALEYQPGAEIKAVGGTWWNAFNAVTYISDHHLGKTQDSRMANAWFGANRGRKANALELAVAYAKKAA